MAKEVRNLDVEQLLFGRCVPVVLELRVAEAQHEAGRVVVAVQLAVGEHGALVLLLELAEDKAQRVAGLLLAFAPLLHVALSHGLRHSAQQACEVGLRRLANRLVAEELEHREGVQRAVVELLQLRGSLWQGVVELCPCHCVDHDQHDVELLLLRPRGRTNLRRHRLQEGSLPIAAERLHVLASDHRRSSCVVSLHDRHSMLRSLHSLRGESLLDPLRSGAQEGVVLHVSRLLAPPALQHQLAAALVGQQLQLCPGPPAAVALHGAGPEVEESLGEGIAEAPVVEADLALAGTGLNLAAVPHALQVQACVPAHAAVALPVQQYDEDDEKDGGLYPHPAHAPLKRVVDCSQVHDEAVARAHANGAERERLVVDRGGPPVAGVELHHHCAREEHSVHHGEQQPVPRHLHGLLQRRADQPPRAALADVERRQATKARQQHAGRREHRREKRPNH
mmetsp:Transcript_12474/g.49941  ORF Transcript_12474/g.49941 Transcript_12474/m.49941 type:complete len:451 (+) Transcript_12474:3454-4806(+)